MKKLFYLWVALLFSATAIAQTRIITGVVKNAEGKPLADASVVVSGSSVGTTTNAEGAFSLSVDANAKTLSISSVGMAPQTVSIINSTNVSVVLMAENKSLQEVVVVGYGTQKERVKTQSVSTIKADAFQNQPIISATQVLQGQAAGVQMTNSSGVLGGQSNIRIRGAASLAGNGQPLFVIDGVPLNDDLLSSVQGGGTGLNPLVDINPNDIESISVLKDAAAVSIYGSRGANGVVLVKTKRGRTNQKTKINLDVFTGMSSPTNLIEMMNADQYKNYEKEFRAARGLAPVVRPDGGFDWIDAVVQNGQSRSINLSATGGSEKTRFFVGGTYLSEDAYTIGNDLNRLSGRLNFDHDVNSNVKFGANFNISNSRSDRIGVENNTNAPLTSAYLQLPYVQPRDADGKFVNTGFISNVLAIEALNINDFLSRRYYGNIFTEIKIFNDFKFRSDWGIDIVNVEERSRTNSLLNPAGAASRFITQNQKWLTTNTLNYEKNLGSKHYIGALLGQAFETTQFDDITVSATGFASDQLPNVASGSTPTTTTATRSAWALESFFTRLNYRYNDRYLLELTVRSDGSSRFGTNNKYGNFWAVSGGWIVSDENFFKNINAINFLKLSASYGTAGNDRIGNFPYQALYSGGVAGDYNGQAGLIPTQTPNPDLQWEESGQLDLGFSMSLLKSRINLEMNVFRKKTTNALVAFPLPFTTGFTSQNRNVGQIENKGIDILLNTVNIRKRDFEWNTSFNIGFLKNTVLSLPENKDPEGRNFLAGSTSQRAIVGESLNTFYLIRYLGVNPTTGDAEWLDRNGKPTTTPIANDRVVAGSAIPKFTGGITNTFKYNGFELSAFFNFSYGNKVLIDGLRFMENLNSAAGFNKSVDVLDYWKKPGDVTFAPNLASATALTYNQLSTLQLQDGSYLRLKTLSLGYNLPKSLLSKIKAIQNARFYVLGQNLWTLQNKNFRGPDPEVSANGGSNLVQGESFFALPQARTMTLGFNLTF
jgi:TonB-linked SusC/RagA family outer membrane protein